MKNFLFVMMVSSLCITSSFAQQKMMENLKQQVLNVKNKTMLVVLKDEKKEENKLYNEFIKKAVESEWGFNADIEFIEMSSFKEIDDAKKANSAYMMHGDAKSRSKNVTSFDEVFFVGSFEDKEEAVLEGFDFNKKTTLAEVYQLLQKTQFYLSTMAAYEYKKMSMKDVKAGFNEQAVYAQNLKKQTLYIDKDRIEKGLEDKIASLYKYEYKLVDKEDIEKAIIDNDKSIAYVSYGAVLDADTGRIVLQYIQPTGKVMISSPVSAFSSSKLTLKEFKDLVKYLD